MQDVDDENGVLRDGAERENTGGSERKIGIAGLRDVDFSFVVINAGDAERVLLLGNLGTEVSVAASDVENMGTLGDLAKDLCGRLEKRAQTGVDLRPHG